MITKNQIKAARALIGWSQSDLAKNTGISTPTIANIELGKQKPSASTLGKIQTTFLTNGVEFTSDGGLRPCQTKVKTYRGKDEFRSFYDDVYNVAVSHSNPDLCITSNDEKVYYKWLGSDYAEFHAKRMSDLKTVHPRVLIRDDDPNAISTSYCFYKRVPKEQYTNVPLYIYGNKVAFVEFFNYDVAVTVIDHTELSNSLRGLFEISWNNAT